jgi:hypothetical protein
MNQDLWPAIDSYLCETLIAADDAFCAALRDSETAGLLEHKLAPNQGKSKTILRSRRAEMCIRAIRCIPIRTGQWNGGRLSLPRFSRLLKRPQAAVTWSKFCCDALAQLDADRRYSVNGGTV